MRALVRAQSERFSANRSFALLVLRELFDGGTARLEAPIHSAVTNAIRPLIALITAGQERGVFRADLDPRFAAISTISQVAYFTIAQPLVATLMDQPTPVPVETSRAFGLHAADWAIRALKA